MFPSLAKPLRGLGAKRHRCLHTKQIASHFGERFRKSSAIYMWTTRQNVEKSMRFSYHNVYVWTGPRRLVWLRAQSNVSFHYDAQLKTLDFSTNLFVKTEKNLLRRKLVMADSVSIDVTNQTAAYSSSAMKQEKTVQQNELSCVVEIRSPQSSRARSFTCRNCEGNGKQTRFRQTLFTRLRSYLIAGRNIEAKLKKFNVKSHHVASPFSFLRKLFGALFQLETEAKFTGEELEKLTETQLGELKTSLQDLVAYKRKELKQEQLCCIGEREDLEKTKKKAKELEDMAWATLRPFVNKHPSLDDLTRVLMF